MRIKTITLSIVSLVVMGCNTLDNSGHKFIRPLSSFSGSDSIKDAFVSAEFTSIDFNWMGGNLTMSVFSEDLYDILDIHMMTAGDTILYNQDSIIVGSIENRDDYIIINGGIEEGGAEIKAYEGGTYRAVMFDDHSVYTKVCYTQVPLSENFTIVDCREQYDEPSDTISSNQKLYIENLSGYKKEFSRLNTKVLIENGEIKEINRRWIP